MKWALKNTLTDAFGWQISHNMGKVVFGESKGKEPLFWGGKRRHPSQEKYIPTELSSESGMLWVTNMREPGGYTKKEEHMGTLESNSHRLL